MSNNGVEVPLKWKISIEGAQDVKQKLREIDDAYARQEVSIHQVAQANKKGFSDLRAINNEQRINKEIYLASNPALNSFAKSMSTVGSISNTLLGITNAVNLAQLASIGVNGKVSAAQQQLAADQRQYQIDLRDFPNDVALHNADLNKIAADQSDLSKATKDATFEMITSWITFSSSIALISNQVVQSIAKIGPALQGSTFAASMLTYGLPIVVFIGTLELGIEMFKKLNPEYAKSMDELQGILQRNWNVDSITAQIVAPFVGAYLGIAKIEDDISETLYNWVNQIINTINTIPNAVNQAFGRVVIPTLQNVLPPGFANNGQNSFYNQAIRDLNISSSGSVTKTSSWQAFAEEQKNTTKKADDLVNIWTTATNPTLQKVSDGITTSNSLLTGLVDSAQQANQRAVYQSQIQTQSNQAASIQAQIAQLQGQKATPGDLSGVDAEFNKSQYIANIASQNAQIDEQIKPLQDKLDQLEVGNQASLTSYLGSIGLSGDYGIGSVVSSALGGASAGWTSGDVDEFIRTHDYGVFTRAAIRDNTVTTPTHDDQIKAWMKATGGSEADAKHALHYSASGYDGIVSSATAFVAGESGAERVNIRPVGSNSSSGQNVTNFYITVQGTVLAENNLRDLVGKFNKQGLKSRGFGL